MMRTTLIAVAVAAGGGAGWLALSASPNALPEAQTAVVTHGPAMEEVLVAAVAVPVGGKIGAEQLRWQSWPEDAVQAAFISRSAKPEAVGEFEGFVARNDLVAGEPIIGEKLAPAGSGFLSAVLENGKRAAAVRISAENTAGGFVLPDDRVDVLHTTTCQAGDGCPTPVMTRTILRNIKVLAIDQQGQEGAPETVVVGKTATLELTPSQSELIVGAQASGMLSLVLRPTTEHAGSQDVVQEDPTPETRTVRVRRGSTVDEVVVR